MVDNTPLVSHFEMKVKNPSDNNNPGDSTFTKDKKITKTKNDLMSIVKIIVMVLLSDDETSEDFLSEYSNYTKLSEVLKKLEFNDIIIVENEKFAKNPPKYWMSLIIICIAALHAFPDNSNIECDIIGKAKNKDSDEIGYGVCYSFTVKLEAYDWKQHSVELFIPANSNESKILLLIDDEIKLVD